MNKISLAGFALVGVAFSFISCSKEENIVPIPGKTQIQAPIKDTVTSFSVYFTDWVDSASEVGIYEDPDGPGPKQGHIGGVSLKANTTYEITFFIEDATNKEAIAYLHNKIKNNASQYKICTGNPLGSSVTPTDSDGKYPIGLVNQMITTGSTGNTDMNFTIKYQKDVKNGQCSPGEVYFSVDIPVSIF